MQFKTVPAIDPRYWVAISLASICGCNTGDLVSEVLKMNALSGLAMLALMFAAIALVQRGRPRPGEAAYWLAILVVRTAATNLADLSIGRAHLGYIPASLGAAALLAALVMLRRRLQPLPRGKTLPVDGLYWITMLTAGALGTLIADGLAHSVQPIMVGALVTTAIATLALGTVLALRRRPAWRSVESYWVAIVAVRTWGTNIGDIAAHLLSLPVSLALSGVALAGLLATWRRPAQGAVPATA